ncbi:hypothetical protein [Sphingomonas sp. 2SG]|uniref:hypothetical protein n=1 Tax=Sphingomonas sp. 2SG TaxID=2502201 RepID=UPI0010F9AD45|nr:hypothetical protein [Sphingomonas sp. 2SG]
MFHVPGALEHPAFKAATAMSASLLVIGAAAAYLAGWSQRSIVFNAFGLSPSMLEESIQATMVRGYRSLVALLILTAIWIAALDFLIGKIWKLSHAIGGSKAIRLSNAMMRRASRMGNTLFIFSATTALLVLGIAAGDIAGAFEVRQTLNEVRSDCRRCYIYKTAHGSITALPLAGDKTNLIVASRNGAQIILVADIRSTTRRAPLRKVFAWP